MKKVFSSIFACIAMVGLLSSCVEEQIETAFEVDAAEAYITAKVIDLATETDVTSQSTITSSVGSVSGNQIMIVGNNTISATTVAVTASYTSPNGTVYTKTEPVGINEIRAGGKGYYTVTINVGEITPIEDYTIAFEETKDSQVSKYFFDKAVFTIDGNEYHWAHNESQYLLRGTVEYKIKSGCEVFASDYPVEIFKEKLENIEASFEENNPVKYEAKEVKIIVSAWCYYTAWVALTTDEVVRTYYAIDNMGNKQVIGTMEYWDYSNCMFGQAELPSPNHAEHYIAGHGYDDTHDTAHGHGHGHSSGHGADNAGGGIVYAD